MMNIRSLSVIGLSLTLLLTACGPDRDEEGRGSRAFIPVDTNFLTKELLIPKMGFEYSILHQKGDLVREPGDGKLVPERGKFDFMAFLPIEGASDHGLLWINHETQERNADLGDGGGASLLEVFRDSLAGWRRIGRPHAIDFRTVGGTMANCLGAVTPWGTVLTSEEVEPMNNRYFFRDSSKHALSDSADYDSLPRWQNYGWMVEVDVEQRKAKQKLFSMGRFMHEGNYCMPDQRTVYMLDDNGPAAFFKFVADRPGDYSTGQLYAFAHENPRKPWLALPRDRDSLTYARDMAFKRGATIFIRMEDIEMGNNGLFYITETGRDSLDISRAIALGGKVAPWLESYSQGNGVYDDVLGRILTFDPEKNEMKVFLQGGEASKDKSIHMANPDNLALNLEKDWLVIHEDINRKDKGRNPKGSTLWTNEIYVLDLNIKNPVLDDLLRLAVIPDEAESTGGVWSPDYKALFFNVQDPSPNNPAPFDRDACIVVTGWK